ncbi:MAG TPA: peptidoglycan DD-metalloendopeptidase family protein, partial [Thermoanaerobaculia bacterium]|nr:peptidoglycan DD-metalloendopeptidase family protein [Thermoanaerobaculia bacterium]
AAALTSEFGKTVDLRRLRPGHLLRFHHDRTGIVDSVEMKVIGWGEVDAVRNGDHFDVKSREGTVTEAETTLGGRVDTSLWDAVRGGGESPQLVQQIADIFQWDIDFFALRKGDSFSLVVRKKYVDGDPVGSGKIMAARFQHRGKTYEAFRNDDAEGQGGYYDGAGAPLQKQFLRAPLRYSRITSGFSMNRYHPILHILRPHHGVDYGAPVGTPVMTTANGVVLDAGRKGGAGNYIRISHGNHIETHYLHLSRFAKGIRPGCKVTQGEVIGYVGATGLATGPHLDYRISDNGEWLDPMKLRSTTPDPLRGKGLEEFRARIARLQPRLAAPAEQVAQVAPKRRALF